jgi:hypothetical protein
MNIVPLNVTPLGTGCLYYEVEVSAVEIAFTRI